MMKITKVAIYPQRFDRSVRNLIRWCKMGLLTALTVKKSNFTNPRWRTAAILRTVKSPCVCNRLTDFDEIWHDDGYWPSTAERPLKFRIFKNSRWRQPPSIKSRKSRYLRNGLTDHYEIWCADTKWVSQPPRLLKNFNFTNPRWRTAAILRTVTSSYLSNLLTDFY